MNEYDNNGIYNDRDRAADQGNAAGGAWQNGYASNGYVSNGYGTNDRGANGYGSYEYGRDYGNNYGNEYGYTRAPQGYGEYSYEPPQDKKKSRKGRNAAFALLCVVAIGTSFAAGYHLFSEKNPLDHSSAVSVPDRRSDSSETKEEAPPARDLSNLPTIETLAAPDDAMSIPDIVKKMSPSVVGISCITDGAQVSGTGIIMSEDGYIVTNAHVVEGASAISVVVTDSTKRTEKKEDSSSKSVAEKILEKQNSGSREDSNIEAELVGIDVQTDLAVIKIQSDGLTKAEFGRSGEIVVGELAIVIGNPLGFDLANTVTSGIISATDRSLTIEDRTMNLIQTDASINSGNSGGPLINAYGQVIGITSAKILNVEGLGFAIPIDEAKVIVDDLIRYGYVKGRPTLGISGQTIGAFYAQYYGVPEGFIVRSVERGSAAEAAGIEVNDIVVGIEGELITSIEEFNEIKSLYKAGDTISVSVYRNNNIVDLKVTLDEAVDRSAASSGSDDRRGGYYDYDPYDPYGWGNYYGY